MHLFSQAADRVAALWVHPVAACLSSRLSRLAKTGRADLAVTCILLVLVLIPSIGVAVKGARRWLKLGPISLQPAEMVKLVAVFYVAAYLTHKGERIKEFKAGFLPPCWWSGY